jgi:hypothetical protein
VGKHVSRLEHRFEVGRDQVDSVELQGGWPECRIARVDADDARHRRVGSQPPQDQLAGCTRYTRDRNGRHGPTMPS